VAKGAERTEDARGEERGDRGAGRGPATGAEAAWEVNDPTTGSCAASRRRSAAEREEPACVGRAGGEVDAAAGSQAQTRVADQASASALAAATAAPAAAHRGRLADEVKGTAQRRAPPNDGADSARAASRSGSGAERGQEARPAPAAPSHTAPPAPEAPSGTAPPATTVEGTSESDGPDEGAGAGGRQRSPAEVEKHV